MTVGPGNSDDPAGTADSNTSTETTADSAMSTRFIAALRAAETNGSTDALAELYGPSAQIGNVVDGEVHEGADGARTFWTAYVDQLANIRSDFALVADTDCATLLEWTVTGDVGGQEHSYRGVTVLETSDGMITRSMAYFDAGALGRRLQHDIEESDQE